MNKTSLGREKIGRRSGPKIAWLVLAAILLNGCGLLFWDKANDYYYQIKIANNTNDTLSIVLNDSVSSSFNRIQILPHDTVVINDGRKINEGDDVMKALFTNNDREHYRLACVFKNDRLLVKWDGPSFSDSDSIHHFFNHNSWKNWLINDSDGAYLFSIEASDFESH